MSLYRTASKKCERCKKKTKQENKSEGFGGTTYYEDWVCVECGCYNLIPKKGEPKFVTEYSINA